MITPTALIEKFQYMLNNKWGYILNTAGQLWTAEDQRRTTNETAIAYGAQWIGHYVADCSGAFTWSFAQLGGYMYHGSNTMYRKYTTEQGPIKAVASLQPGCAVFKRKKDTTGKWSDGWDYYHVGLYIGNGKVIEAKSTRKGVVMSSVNEWGYYGKLKGVQYDGAAPGSDDIPDKDDVSPGKAVVRTPNQGTVRVREKPSKTGKVITTLREGTVVNVLEDVDGWCKVEFEMTGYVMDNFLKPEVGTDA